MSHRWWSLLLGTLEPTVRKCLVIKLVLILNLSLKLVDKDFIVFSLRMIMISWFMKFLFIDQDLLKLSSFYGFIHLKELYYKCFLTMKDKITLARRPNGDKITNQSAPFQQVVPPLKGVAISILSTASYRRQPPLKGFFILVLSLNVTYSNYCIAPSGLIHCASCSWYRIGI